MLVARNKSINSILRSKIDHITAHIFAHKYFKNACTSMILDDSPKPSY